MGQPRTFNYIDKKGRLLPRIDTLMEKHSRTGKEPNPDKYVLLYDLRKEIVNGNFDWQPAE